MKAFQREFVTKNTALLSLERGAHAIKKAARNSASNQSAGLTKTDHVRI